MRFFIFIMLFVAQFAQAAPKPEEWDITQLSDQTFVFDKKKVTVMVDVDFAPDKDEAVAKFIRSSDFVKAMKLLRNSNDLGLEGEPVTVSATRKQYGTTYVGITESLFKLGDRSAVLTEHWWVKSHLTFHVSILSRGTFARSDEEQEKIFEPFAQDLGLIAGKTALYGFLLPDAYADELGVSRNRQTQRSSNPAASGAIDCKRDAAKFGIDPALARQGAPKLSPAFSASTCKAGVTRIWTETKKSVLDLGKEYAARADRFRRQLGCTGFPPPPKYESARRNETYYGMFARWSRNVGTAFGQAGATQMAAQCEEAAGNGAIAQMAGNAVVSTVKGLVTLGQLTQQLQTELTVGQVRRTYQLIRYGKIADDDPMFAFSQMVSDKWSGFGCYNSTEQAAKICKVGAEVGIFVGSMAVGGGISAAARLAKIAGAVGRVIETEQAASKALLAAREAKATAEAARAAQTLRAANAEREVAANAVRRLNMTPAERVRASKKILGRELSPAERDIVERAHAFGKVGRDGKYSVGDLREKLRIMTEGGLSREDALKLLRTGVTGEAPTAAIAAATTGAAETRAPTAPATGYGTYEKAWKAADRADTATADALSDFRAQLASGNTAEAMNSLRDAQSSARVAGRAYEDAAAMGKSPQNYRFAMENYITAGDPKAAANARLAAVRTLGDSPSAISSELRTAITKLEANPRVKTDTMLSQRLGFLRSTLREFEQGSQSAVAQFERSGAVRAPSTAAARTSPRSLTDPAPVKPSAPVAAIERTAPVAPKPAPAAARVMPLRNDPYLNMAESLKTDGNVAVNMVREAVESRSTERINNLVTDLRSQLPANPTETQKAQLLRSVQEIRRLDATGALTTGNESALRSLERGLIQPERNPISLATKGKVTEAAQIYRERLQNGWPRNVVERDIKGEIRNATMMRDAIARGRVRIKNDTAMWDRIIDTNQRVLRELDQ